MSYSDILKEALSALAENSPFALVVVIVVCFSYLMYKHGVKTISSLYENAIENIRILNQESIEQLRKTIKFLDELHSKTISTDTNDKSKKSDQEENVN